MRGNMTQTFQRLPLSKQRRVLAAAADEFGEKGFENGSLDGIVKRADISKGGLYEYIRSKEELFLGAVDYCYAELYGFIQDCLEQDGAGISKAVVDVVERVAMLAIDYYLEHPREIGLLVYANRVQIPELKESINNIFFRRIEALFGNADFPEGYPRDRVVDILRNLFLKTRNAFLSGLYAKRDRDDLRREYMEEWRFLLGILRHGLQESSDIAKE